MKQFCPQKSPEFCCVPCQYITSNKKDFNKHLITAKHEKNVNVTEMKQNGDKYKCANKYTCKCNKIFTNRTSLWRHTKNNCNNTVEVTESTTMLKLIQQNEEFKTIIMEQNNKVLDLCEIVKNNVITPATVTTNNTMINSNNKSFNLNVFLNEKCKDAMNMNDFVDSIQITVDDIEDMGKLGYVNGLSKLIIKNLKAIDVHLRPVHCTDQRRETVYMKEKNKWNKDNDDKEQIRNFIKLIANKNSKNVNLFKRKYPDCDDYYSKYNDQYNKIIMEAFGGFNTKEYDSETKIIKKLVKEISIDKT